MRRVANNRLIEVTYPNLNLALGICNRAQVANVTVATYPYGWTVRHSSLGLFEPFVKLYRVATHVSVGGLRHLQVLAVEQPSAPLAWFGLLEFRHLARRRSGGRFSPRRLSHPAHGLQPCCAEANGDQSAKRICHRGRHPQTHGPLMDQASRRHG
jgi:hypothetical protein